MGSQPLPAQRARLIALGLRPSAWQSSRPVSGRGQGRSRRRRGRAAPALSPADRRSTSSTVALWGGTARVIDLIWVKRERKYFCKRGWTGQINRVREPSVRAAITSCGRHFPLTNCTQPSCCDFCRPFLSSSNSATPFPATVIARAATLYRSTVRWNGNMNSPFTTL